MLGRRIKDLLESVGFISVASSACLQVVLDSVRESASVGEELLSWGMVYATAAFCMSIFANKSWKPFRALLPSLQLAIGVIATLAFPALAVQKLAGLLTVGETGAEKYGLGSLTALGSFGLLATTLVAGNKIQASRAVKDGELKRSLLSGLALAMLGRAMSYERFDAWWMSSHLVFFASWIVFLIDTAIDDAIRHKEALENAAESEALHQISWALVGVQSPMELLNILVATVRESVGAEIVTMYLTDETEDVLHTAAISGPDICLRSLGSTYPVSSTDRRPGFHSGHTARAFLSKEVQVADDIFVDVEFVPWRLVARADGRAISLPIVHKDKRLGVLNVYFSDRRDATEQRLRFLKTVVAAVTPSVEMVRSSIPALMKHQSERRAA